MLRAQTGRALTTKRNPAFKTRSQRNKPTEKPTQPTSSLRKREIDSLCDNWSAYLGLNCKVNVGEEAAIKDRQHGGEIPSQYLVRSNERSYDTGSKLIGRFGDPAGAYVSLKMQYNYCRNNPDAYPVSLEMSSRPRT